MIRKPSRPVARVKPARRFSLLSLPLVETGFFLLLVLAASGVVE